MSKLLQGNINISPCHYVRIMVDPLMVVSLLTVWWKLKHLVPLYTKEGKIELKDHRIILLYGHSERWKTFYYHFISPRKL